MTHETLTDDLDGLRSLIEAMPEGEREAARLRAADLLSREIVRRAVSEESMTRRCFIVERVADDDGGPILEFPGTKPA